MLHSWMCSALHGRGFTLEWILCIFSGGRVWSCSSDCNSAVAKHVRRPSYKLYLIWVAWRPCMWFLVQRGWYDCIAGSPRRSELRWRIIDSCCPRRRRNQDRDNVEYITVAAYWSWIQNSPVFLQLSLSLDTSEAQTDKDKALLHRESRLTATTFCNLLLMIIRISMHIFSPYNYRDIFKGIH